MKKIKKKNKEEKRFGCPNLKCLHIAKESQCITVENEYWLTPEDDHCCPKCKEPMIEIIDDELD